MLNLLCAVHMLLLDPTLQREVVHGKSAICGLGLASEADKLFLTMCGICHVSAHAHGNTVALCASIDDSAANCPLDATHCNKVITASVSVLHTGCCNLISFAGMQC